MTHQAGTVDEPTPGRARAGSLRGLRVPPTGQADRERVTLDQDAVRMTRR